MEFKDKKVIVTGSSDGIGKAIAKAFAKEGAFVVINGSRNERKLYDAEREILALGGKCAAVFGDVSDYGVCQDLFTVCGGCDILVNNAGIAHIGLFTDMKIEQWHRLLNVNLVSAINCAHIALPYMVRQKSGVIINVSSVWGSRGASCEAVYSATKGGLEAFTKAIAKEYGISGIRTNAISCGVIDTKMNDCFSEEEKQALAEEISLNRFGSAEEIAEVALFLASRKSSYINGQVIGADGGM